MIIMIIIITTMLAIIIAIIIITRGPVRFPSPKRGVPPSLPGDDTTLCQLAN